MNSVRNSLWLLACWAFQTVILNRFSSLVLCCHVLAPKLEGTAEAIAVITVVGKQEQQR